MLQYFIIILQGIESWSFTIFLPAARDLSTCDRLGAVVSPSRLGHRLVLATARQTQVCLRVAVLSRWPQPRSAANLASPTRSRLSPWSSSSRSSKPRSLSRSPHGSLPTASSPYRGAGLCRGIPLRVRLALQGESAEPSPCASLSSTLGFSACSSHNFSLRWPAASRDSGAERRVRERGRGRAAGGERRDEAVRRPADARRKRDKEAYPPTQSCAADRTADDGSVAAANGAGREGSGESRRRPARRELTRCHRDLFRARQRSGTFRIVTACAGLRPETNLKVVERAKGRARRPSRKASTVGAKEVARGQDTPKTRTRRHCRAETIASPSMRHH